MKDLQHYIKSELEKGESIPKQMRTALNSARNYFSPMMLDSLRKEEFIAKGNLSLDYLCQLASYLENQAEIPK